jgi:hypothetical protein
VLVRELRPQGREPWCTGSQGSAPLSQATPLEAARINLKRFPPDRCQFVTPPSYPLAKLPSRQGASHWCGHAPRWPRQMAMRATPGWLGITPLTRPSGERCLSQAGEFACPWASTEFPDLSLSLSLSLPLTPHLFSPLPLLLSPLSSSLLSSPLLFSSSPLSSSPLSPPLPQQLPRGRTGRSSLIAKLPQGK